MQNHTYDVGGRKVFESEWVPMGTSSPAGTTYEYWVPYIGSAGPIAPGADPTSYGVDPLGRLTRVIRGDGAITEYAYDALKKWVTTYDLNRTPGGTAPAGAPTQTQSIFTNDVYGRLVYVDSPSGGFDADYTYDIRDNLVRVEMGVGPAAQAREFTYDGLGRLVRSVNPENGETTFDAFGPTGLLLQRTDSAGRVTKYTYDDAGRVKTESRGLTTGDVLLRAYDYDGDAGGGGAARFGRLTMADSYAEDGTHVVNRKFSYSGLNGRLSMEIQTFGGLADQFKTLYAYNAFGLLSEVTYPDMPAQTPTIVSYDYLNGFLDTVGDGIDVDTFVGGVTYNPAGGKEIVAFGNDTQTIYHPDALNRPQEIEVKVPDVYAQVVPQDTVPAYELALASLPRQWRTPEEAASQPLSLSPGLPSDLLAQIVIDPPGGGGGGGGPTLAQTWTSGTYQYDGAGNIIAIGADTFTYDELSRLTDAAMYNFPGSVSAFTLTYSYDGYGNMTQRTRAAPGSTFTWDFNCPGGDPASPGCHEFTNNQIQHLDIDYDGLLTNESRPFVYDLAGNLIDDGKNSYVFDPSGRLKEVRDKATGASLGAYAYDEQGYRVHKTEAGIETFYVRDFQGRVLSEYRRPEGSNASPAWDQDYVYALGGAIALVKNETPLAPGEFVSSLLDPNTVELRWTKSAEDDIYGYRVYRRETGTSPWTLIDTGGGYSVLQASAGDPVVLADPGFTPGLVYEYRAVTVDTAANTSGDSRWLTVDTDGLATELASWQTPPLTPGDGQMELHWDASPAATTLGYRLCRSTSSDHATFLPIGPALLYDPGYIDIGLVNGQPYYYKVIVQNSSEGSAAQTCTDTQLVVQTGTPVDNVPPPAPLNVRAQAHPTTQGVYNVFWSLSYASDLAGYRIYRDDTPPTLLADIPASGPPASSFAGLKVNFTSATGEAVAGFTNVTELDTWSAGQPYGWIVGTQSIVSVDHDTPGLDERRQSNIHYDPANPYDPGNPPATFRMDVGPGEFEVRIAIGSPAASTEREVHVNGFDIWECSGCVFLNSGEYGSIRRVIQSDANGYLDLEIYGGVHINSVEVGAIVGQVGATLVRSTTSVARFLVSAYDVAGNEATSSDASSNIWEIADDTAADTPLDGGLDHHIWEWGASRKYPGTTIHLPYEGGGGLHEQYGYGFPVFFRAAQISAQPELYFDPNVGQSAPKATNYQGLKFYRGSCADLGTLEEYVELTPNPVFDPNNNYWVDYMDHGPPAACQTYYVTVVDGSWESLPLQLDYTYAYEPWQVMGQYAYGALMEKEDDNVSAANRGAMAIRPPDGGWELGYTLPGDPIVLKWTLHADPAVVGYRIWVADHVRNESGNWKWLADVPAWENSYLDYDAPCNWPVKLKAWSGGYTDWNLQSCIVYPGDPGHLCPSEPSDRQDVFGDLAFYYVEGLTDLNAPKVPAMTTFPGTADAWYEAVRAAKQCEGECPNDGWTCVPLDPNDPNKLNCAGESCPPGSHTRLWLDAPLATPSDEFEIVDAAVSGSQPNHGQDGGDAVQGFLAREKESVIGHLEVQRIEGASLSSLRTVAAQLDENARPAPDRLVGQVAPNSRIEWLHTDHLGSTRLVTASTGAVISRHKYLPFGEEFADDGDASPNSHKFTGHERDEGTGLDYMMARYFGPDSEFRFLSVDPAVASIEPALPVTWNRYSYVVNNPIRLLDPSGETVQVAIGGPTANNGFGHSALIVNGTVYSSGTNYSGRGDDWGVSMEAYFSTPNQEGNSQDDLRETTIYELDVTEEQEAALTEIVGQGEGGHDTLGNNCADHCEDPLEGAGILEQPEPNEPTVTQNGSVLQKGTSDAKTPEQVEARVKNSGKVKETTTRGTAPARPASKTGTVIRRAGRESGSDGDKK